MRAAILNVPRQVFENLEAERNFRKIVGYHALAKLDAALRAHDAVID